MTFEYQVVRAWQVPVAEVLTGGLGTLPMAPLGDLSQIAPSAVIRRMKERINAEVTSPGEAGRLWTATYVLMGLRYAASVITQLLEGVREMEESVTYQAIIRRGRTEEARAILLRQGTKRFGPPSAETQAALESITAIERLEQLSERLLDVESWDELLAG